MRKFFSLSRQTLVLLALLGVAMYAALVPAVRWAAALLALILVVRIGVLWLVGNNLARGLDVAVRHPRWR